MIRQLSVLVENKPGSLMEVTSRLTEAHVKKQKNISQREDMW